MAENARRGDDFRYEIVKNLGVLSTSQRGWTKEFNIVRWNDKDPKYDIRDWSADHEKMSRGVTLTRAELEELAGCVTEELA